MLKIIYFDYHGVLDRRTMRGLLETCATVSGTPQPAAFMATLEPMVYAYASGQAPPADFWSRLLREYGRDITTAAKKYALHVDPVRTMWDLLNHLHQHYELGLFTDCASDQREIIRHAYDLPTFFDVLIFLAISGSKRDRMMYQYLTQGGRFRPDDCLVIDDVEDNVAMAQALGFPAWQLKNLSTAAQEITQLLTTNFRG